MTISCLKGNLVHSLLDVTQDLLLGHDSEVIIMLCEDLNEGVGSGPYQLGPDIRWHEGGCNSCRTEV